MYSQVTRSRYDYWNGFKSTPECWIMLCDLFLFSYYSQFRTGLLASCLIYAWALPALDHAGASPQTSAFPWWQLLDPPLIMLFQPMYRFIRNTERRITWHRSCVLELIPIGISTISFPSTLFLFALPYSWLILFFVLTRTPVLAGNSIPNCAPTPSEIITSYCQIFSLCSCSFISPQNEWI